MIIGGWILLFQLPVQTRITDYDIKLMEYAQKEKQHISEAKLSQMEVKVDSLRVRFEREKNRVFNEKRLSYLGSEIGKLAKKYSLSLFDVAPKYDVLKGFAESTEEIAELPLTIELRGKFQEFAHFLDDLDALPFIMRIDETLLEKVDQSGSELKIVLQGVILIRKERDDENTIGVKLAQNQA